MDAILYLTRAGCSWRMLPKDFPPWQTVYGYFREWRNDGTLKRLHDALREQVRAKESRNAEPSAGIVDSQSVKGADTVPSETRGYDAGKKINGRKRHIVVDTIGLLLVVMVTAASVQDRAGGESILERLRGALRSVVHVFADGGYQGSLVELASVRGGSPLRSSRNQPSRSGSRCFPAAGLSRERSLGLCAGDASCATTSGYPRPTKRWSTGR